jgi:nitrite reductase (NO-forming)
MKGFLAIGGFVMFAWLAIAIGVAAIRSGGDDDDSAVAQQPTPTAQAGGSVPLVIDVELGELYVEPNRVEVPAGVTLVLNVTNAGAVQHDLKLDGTTGTAMLDPGASETIELGPFEESAQAWCTVPGHKQAGMLMDIVVEGSEGGGPGGEDPPAEDNFAAIDPQATPEVDWQPFDPNLQPAPGGTEHQISFDATETVIEVAPGVTQEMWTFNDQVPGPILRGKVGDVFTVTLTNKGALGHSIDFHSSKVAWDDEMRTIQPGESLVYQYEAKHAGIYMYHCGTAPALHHIGNGMFGAIIIEPPDLAPVDHEYVLVQSELYLGPEGEPGDLTKMQNDEFDAVVFNGYYNQYFHRPIQVEAHERIRVWVLDAGPSENSAFHIVGTVFDTVYKEGAYLLQPDDLEGGSQVLDLQPAQGGFVEFEFDEDGLYLIVTHKFSNVGKGALGVFQAGDAEAPGGGH